MEVFYHQRPNEGIDWAQINDYLCSPDSENVELGLLLLEQNPQSVKYAELGLNLLKHFDKSSYQLRAQVLINSFLDRKKAEKNAQLFIIFSEHALSCLRWVEFAKLLNYFEQESHIYTPYMEKCGWYEIHFATLAHNLLKYAQDADKCWVYTQKVLDKNAKNLKARMCWVELLMRYFLPKGQHREECNQLEQVLLNFYHIYPNLKPLMGYYLSVFYIEFTNDEKKALVFLQYIEKVGIQQPFYTQVLAYLKQIQR
jgi:hypothetical protein